MQIQWKHVNTCLEGKENEIVASYGKQLKMTDGINMIERDSLRCYRTYFDVEDALLQNTHLCIDFGYQTHIIKIEFYLNNKRVARSYSSEEYLRFIVPSEYFSKGKNCLFAVITEGAEMGIRGNLVTDSEYISEIESMPKEITISKCQPLPNVVSAKVQEDSIILQLDNGTAGEITFFEKGVFRFKAPMDATGRVDDLCIEQLNDNLKRIKTDATEDDDKITFRLGDNTVIVNFKPLLFKVKNKNGRVIFNQKDISLKTENTNGIVLELAEDEHFFGINENGVPHLDKRGSCEDIWVRHDFDRCDVYSPFFISTLGYGFYLNSSYHSIFDMGHLSHDTALLYTYTQNIDFFFFGKEDPADIVELFSAVTGRPTMIPKWSFGFWQAGGTVLSKEGAMGVVKRFNEENIPIDVLCLDPAWQVNHGDLIWSDTTFPNYKEFIEFLKKENNMHLILWTSPFANQEDSEVYKEGLEKGMFTLDEKGNFLRSHNWTGFASGLMDFEEESTKDWYRKKLSGLMENGADGFKLDGGDTFETPERMFTHKGYSFKEMHNLYPILFAKTFHEVMNEFYPDKRLITWERTGFTGSGKYPATWGGDQLANFKGMRNLIKGGQGCGVLAVPFWSEDIGGFSFTDDTDEELFIRSFQWGVLCPLARAHGVKTEPFAWSDVGLKITGDAIRLRYSLFPYLYSLAYISHKTGRPIMYPLFFFDSKDQNTYSCDYQYGFGPFIMVAPIFEHSENEEKTVTRTVYLPKGDWIDYKSKEIISGGKNIVVTAGLSDIPIYIKSGAIIPYSNDIRRISEMSLNSMTVEFYPDGNKSEFIWYDDEGENLDYLKNINNQVKFTLLKDDKISIDISTLNAEYNPDYEGEFRLKIFTDGINSAKVNGKPVDFEFDGKFAIINLIYRMNEELHIEID